MGVSSLHSQAVPRPVAPLESVDPATGEVIGRFEATPPDQVPAAIARAHQAAAEWAAMPLRQRCAYLRRLRDVLYDRRQEVVQLISRENGKPRVEALFAEVLLALDAADYYARRAPRLLRPQRVPHHNPALRAKSGRLHLEPYGVIGIISPWNYPFAIPMTQVITAVVVGNAVVLKPSELTPWCGAVVGQLFEQAGFPAGVVQVVQGGGEVGTAMIAAGSADAPGSGVDKLLFTGSVATGRRVAQGCAERLIPCVLELGGKDAMLVLADAHLERASSAAVWGAFTNCGQACLSVERLYVEQTVAQRFTELCVEKAQRLRLGPASDPETDVGPMIRLQQLQRVERQLADAVGRGAQVLTGGRRRPDLGPNFFEPTVVTGVDHSMELMREETFGPVLAICPVANADAGVAAANDSPFALAASVWTRSKQRGRKIAARLRAGAVMVNDVASYYGACEAPHGGRGVSGWGRTHGRLGLLEMAHAKYVDVDHLSRWPKAWWYGYNEQLAAAGDRFLELLLAPDWKRRWASLRGALGVLRRDPRHRI